MIAVIATILLFLLIPVLLNWHNVPGETAWEKVKHIPSIALIYLGGALWLVDDMIRRLLGLDRKDFK